MDNTNALVLALKIENANDEVTESLQEGGLTTYNIDGGVVFAFDPDAVETYEELADDVEPTIRLGIINLNDQQYYDRPDLTNKLADYMGIEDEGDIDLSILPDISDFIDENQDAIQDAVSDIQKKYYTLMEDSSATGTPKSQRQEVEENLNYDPSTATFSSAPSVSNEAGQIAAPAQEQQTEYVNEDNSSNSEEAPHASTAGVKEALPTFGKDVVNYEPKPTEYLNLARELFADADETEMLEFDPHTHQQLQGSILDVEKNIAQGRGQGVKRIYERILNALPEIENAFEADFKPNEKAHQHALDVIEANEKDDIKQTTDEHEDKYEAAKEQFIESQREPLGQKYDAEHKQEATQALNAELNAIRSSNEALRHQENSKFKQFKADEKKKYVENELRKNIDISDIMSDYNKLINADMNILKEKGTSFVDQVGVVTHEMATKLKTAQGEASKYKSLYENLNENYSAKLDANVASKTNDNLQVIQAQLQSKQQELSAKASENQALQEALKNAQERAKKLQNDLESSKEQVNLLKSRPVAAPAAPMPEVTQTTQPQETRTQESHAKRKSHLGAKIAGSVVGVIAIVGLSVSSTAMVMNHRSKNAQTEQTTQRSSSVVKPAAKSSSSSSSSSDSSEKQPYQKGDTWTYHSNSDNKNYTVTMDNPTTGHYTDSNGLQHTVTLNHNN